MTFPVGVPPVRGLTLTESFSDCSCPNLTLAADSFSVVVVAVDSSARKACKLPGESW